MMQKTLLPKEMLIPEMKKEMQSKLKEAVKALGITDFKLVDLEWDEKGLVIYYDSNQQKNFR